MTTASDEAGVLIGLVSISDRASTGVYADQGLPALRDWMGKALATPWRVEERLIADDQPTIERTLIELADHVGCHLIITTGGTGPAPRDQTPEALDESRQAPARLWRGDAPGQPGRSADRDPVAAGRGVRGRALIITLPGKPKAIAETLDGIFAAVPYCLDLIGGPYVETHGEVVRAFRPRSAQRPPAG
jgi:molybdopterin adenylyltransferase